MSTLRTMMFSALALGAAALFIRLGFWQLDRLETRRAFNQAVLEQRAAPPLDLNAAAGEDFDGMAYRSAVVSGTFLYEYEIALRNQRYYNTPGYRLFTPMKIDGAEKYVLVDRGFVPGADYEPGDWETFREEGKAEVQGVIRLSEAEPDFGARMATPEPGAVLITWSLINIDLIQRQMPFDLLPIFIQQSPDGPQVENPDSYPARTAPDIELSEGPHLSYAIQWFAFAGVVLLGGPLFIFRSREGEPKSLKTDPVKNSERD